MRSATYARRLVARLVAGLIATSGSQQARSAQQPGPARPIAVVAGGFLIPPEQFTSYAEALRNVGCSSLLYKEDSTLSNPQPVAVSADDIVMNQLRGVGASPLFFVGHSRGCKVAVLAASRAKKMKMDVGGLVLLDPVDSTSKDPSTCLPELEALAVPTAILHAGLSTLDGCAPTGANYIGFADALKRSSTPRLIGALPRAGHTQFVDNRRALALDVCTPGKDKDAGVREVALTMTSAWVGAALTPLSQRTEARKKAVASLREREFAAEVAWLDADL